MALQVFHKDARFWDKDQEQEVEKFFLANSFISKIYDMRSFDRIVAMTIYAQIERRGSLLLDNNKRPQAIILLSGEIDVMKKVIQSSPKKRRNHDQSPIINFKSKGELRQYNSTMKMTTECKINSIGQLNSEILFIPTSLYNSFCEQKQREKVQQIHCILMRKFLNVSEKLLKELGTSGCIFLEYRMNSVVYSFSTFPEYAYILLEGNIRLERSGLSQAKQSLVIISPETIFGDKDLELNQRQNAAVSCSAYSRILAIPKNSFLKFAQSSLPDLVFEIKRYSSSQLSEKIQKDQFKLPKLPLKRFRLRPQRPREEEQLEEYRLIKNSHRLLDFLPNHKSFRSKSALHDYPVDHFRLKIQLFHKKKSSKGKVNLTNRFF